MKPTLLVVFPLVLALIANLHGGRASLSLEPVEDISQETKTEIKFALKAKPADAPKVRFAIGKVRKSGQVVTAPKNMRLDAESGAFSWTPTPSQAGKYEVTLTASDGDGNEASSPVKVTVRERAITAHGGQVGELLKKWHAEGTAAGNTGDFYDNRDGDHSALPRALYPQLDEVMYTPEDRKLRRDWAAQFALLPHVTFGNSSTSAPVAGGGSNIRFYYTNPRGMPLLYQHYRGNNLYIYPAHHDHHPGRNGKPFYGDVYPANSPYLIASQGSSGSDQPFMRAVPLTLAAFRPEVKKKLIDTGLLMPTVQMIFRSSNKHLTDPKEYLTGKAHPPVFEGSWVNDLKMIQMAHALMPDNLPPMIQLKVIEEDQPVAGKDYFEVPGVTEVLADTPAAIARIVRGASRVRRMVVSAEDSFDSSKQPLRFHWVVLRGDAGRIQIKPLNEAGSRVEIVVPYHERRQVEGHHLKIESNRVDIGAFVHNGTYWSAPGFVTFHSLDNEARTYDEKGLLLEIGYGVGDADLSVTDWNALFEMLQAADGGLPSQLLQKSFTAEQRTALARAGAEYKTASAEVSTAADKSKKAGDVRQKAVAELKRAEEKTAAALKANQENASDETLAAYKKAVLERDAAEEVRKKAEADYQAAQKAAETARKLAEGVLTQKKPELDAPVRELIDKALARFRDNPGFYLEQQKEIDALIASAPDAPKGRFLAGRRRLVGLAILKQEADGAFKLALLRDGAAPLEQRLTRFERNALERFHAEVIAYLLYPKFLQHAYKVNLVDFRLTTHKSWRDVYRHDAKGNIAGWTRYDGETVSEFNSAGMLILEKDARGRAHKAQTVQYEIDPAVKLAAVRSLKYVPGNQIVTYEYDGDGDFQGRIKKQDPENK